ncbi:MAG: IS1634 family transposase [Clostridiales bacterium]|nr:IS1634 family transposase [Clostridiales bacterium]
MSYVIEQKVGKYTYLYECTSYRDNNGNPRNSRVIIGKIDLKTGLPVYKPEYLERMSEAGTPVEIPSTERIFSVNDIKQSTVRDYGLFYLLRHLSDKIGLTESLAVSVPHYWQEIFMLACYLISSGDPFLYCEEWIKDTECLPVSNMSSQRISELMVTIKPEEREGFFKSWCGYRSEQEYLALDITSTSSYSELVDDVEWGYNRDHENLPQINICMLMGETSRLPVYQTVYSGSLKDVSTLRTTFSKFDSITDGRPVLAVMDKGFFSRKNVTAMLEDKKIKKFIIAIPFTSSFAKHQVAGERKDIDCVQNTIVVNGDSMRAVSKVRVWNKEHKVFTHIYYNAKKAFQRREELYAHIAILREEAEKSPARYADDIEHTKYLCIRRSEKVESGYTVSIREDVISNELRTAGWVVIISNDIDNAKKAMRIYREKDVVEKGFLRLKKSLDLGRLRVHSQESMQTKVFVGFIALVLLSEIHRVMSDEGMYKNITLKQLLHTLSRHRIQEINGTRIIYPTTKEQRNIYKAFNVEEPV